MATLASFFGWRKPSKKEVQNTIHLYWNKQHFDVVFKTPTLDHALLKDLKLKCKTLTGVPVAAMKLSVSGANLKDDTATLVSCGIRAGSTVVLTGDKADKQTVVQETTSGSEEEYGLIVRIGKVVDPIKATMEKDIADFDAFVDNSTSTDGDKKIMQDKGIYLSEKLMQALITLDGVECPPGFDTARQRRREGVRLLQKLLEQVDQTRAKVKLLCQ
ncbi:hypothetical protein BJV82DRAFT_622764 [Fennellomyces sp. T-0311]|nr:hypothetical protein BJV82DRAFT_622764 [Fennellomyces sp. T-0311]